MAAMIEKADADQPQPAPAENQATQGAPVASTPAPPAQTQPTPPPPSAPPANENYFHRSLAPYGDWIYDGRHGWVWRPTVAVVDTGWQPYCHGGRWIYSDVGWYWHSTYSWGWAPFHYGRWHRSSIHGWYWVPGYRWSPAWVHWRSSNIYCGWAPLPPGCDYVTGVGYMARITGQRRVSFRVKPSPLHLLRLRLLAIGACTGTACGTTMSQSFTTKPRW